MRARAEGSAPRGASLLCAALCGCAGASGGGPARSQGDRWLVRYPLRDDPPAWCAEGTVECRTTGPRCAPSVQVECGCQPNAGCFDARVPCEAPLEPELTRQQRARSPEACCYDLPRHCVNPTSGGAH